MNMSIFDLEHARKVLVEWKRALFQFGILNL